MRRRVGLALLTLAAGLAGNSLLGPLFLGVIRYRYGASMTSQAIGLDAVALFAVVPLSVVAGVMTLRGDSAGPVLGMGPAAFAAYMLPQYVIGPDYEGLPGNNERFVLLHLGLFVLAIVGLAAAWSAADDATVEPRSPRSDRRRAAVMLGLAAFLLFRWIPGVIDVMSGAPSGTSYLDNPTAFLLIGLLDLGVVLPAAVAVATGLARGALWARKGAYTLVGWFALVPLSVAAMAVAMQVRHDPAASSAMTVGFGIAAAVFLAAAAALYRPVLRRPDGVADVNAPGDARGIHRTNAPVRS